MEYFNNIMDIKEGMDGQKLKKDFKWIVICVYEKLLG